MRARVRVLIARELCYLDRYLLFFLLLFHGRWDEKIVTASKLSQDKPSARLFRAAMIDALDINEVMTKYLSQRTGE